MLLAQPRTSKAQKGAAPFDGKASEVIKRLRALFSKKDPAQPVDLNRRREVIAVP
jgi:hypothetical protein